MSPKAFIVIDAGSVTDAVVVGDSNVEVIVLDFDSLEIDAEEARQILLDHGDDLAHVNGPAGARDLRARLQDIVDEADAEEAAEEDDEEDEDFEDEDFDLDMDMEDDDEDFEDEEDDEEDEEDDEKKESDYSGDEFNEATSVTTL